MKVQAPYRWRTGEDGQRQGRDTQATTGGTDTSRHGQTESERAGRQDLATS